MPMSIFIQISSTQWQPAKRLAKQVDREELLGRFARYIATIYSKKVKEDIDSQRYKSRWEPLSPEYLAWKKSQGLSTNIWEASSLARDNIGVWRSNDKYVVGIKRNVTYPGSNIPAYKVIRMLEFGTEYMPARPLFMPIQRDISSNIRRYWDEFIEEYYGDEDDTIPEEPYIEPGTILQPDLGGEEVNNGI